MSIFHQLTEEDIEELGLTHKAIAFGFVPVWIGGIPEDLEDGSVIESEVIVSTRNWVPNILLHIAESIYIFLADNFMPEDADITFPLKITGEIYER